MEYRNLGKSGLKVSELSFGSWVTFVNQLGLKTATSCMSYAYEHGVNFLIMLKHMHLVNQRY